MSPLRLAHETLPPTPPINNFTRITPSVGIGELSPENRKNGLRSVAVAQVKICAAFRLGKNTINS